MNLSEEDKALLEKSSHAEAEDVAARRRNVIDGLIKTGRKVVDPQQIHLDQLKENAELIFQDMPAMARVGQYPPRGYLET